MVEPKLTDALLRMEAALISAYHRRMGKRFGVPLENEVAYPRAGFIKLTPEPVQVIQIHENQNKGIEPIEVPSVPVNDGTELVVDVDSQSSATRRMPPKLQKTHNVRVDGKNTHGSHVEINDLGMERSVSVKFSFVRSLINGLKRIVHWKVPW